MSDGLRWDQGPAAAARDARASRAPIPRWGELDDERDDNVAYEGLGGAYFARRADPERLAKRLVAQLERLGPSVTLQTSTADDAVAA